MFQVKSKIAEKLNIPEDISKDVSIVTITGSSEIYIENYKGIIEYGKECVKIQMKCSRITVTGKGLEIVYYTNEDMKITGEIVSICYS